MAGIRGVRNPFPKKGGKPTGMFSEKGRQKQDGLTNNPHMDTYKYAHSGGGEAKGKPTTGGSSSKRHQPPRKKHA